jgi:small subunit ribosomal protein S8
MHDPIGDMLNRIRNAQAVGTATVSLPYSKLKQEIAVVLKAEGFIAEFEKKGRGVHKRLEITLAYEDAAPRIVGTRRVSTPGQRNYASYKKLFPVANGFGIAVLSTPKGVMSDKEARKQRVGGEIFFEIW